jgi:hypothetical protein
MNTPIDLGPRISKLDSDGGGTPSNNLDAPPRRQMGDYATPKSHFSNHSFAV